MDPTLPPDAPEPSEASVASGARLGAYQIERLIGEGAMGEVYLATHVALGRPVALKTLKPGVASRGLLERFFAEARAVNIIRHENIVECTDLVHDPAGRSYIVMELLEGRTLGAAIGELGRFPPRRAARIVAQIADAIGTAHDKGIIHRDLKPENVFLIRRAGSADYVKVLDFGIARLRPDLGGSATQTGALIGTPAFMSPEQVRGEKVSPSTDIYALGTILFQMLTGRLPFEAASMSLVLVAQLQETASRVDVLAPDVPAALADLVARALAKTPEGRPPDMATFRREVLAAVELSSDPGALLTETSPRLGAAAGYLPTVAPPVPASARSSAQTGQSSISASAGEVTAVRPRRRAWWVVAAVAVVIGGGATAAIVASSRPEERGSTIADTTPPAATPSAPAPAPSPPAPVPPPTPGPVVTAPALEAPATPAPAPKPPTRPTVNRVVAAKPRPAKPTSLPTSVGSAGATGSAAAPSPVAPPPPAVDCSLDGFQRIYEACSDRGAAKAALQRLNLCRPTLSDRVDYDVVKRALVRCL